MSAAKMVADSTQEDLATDHPTKTKRKKGNEKKTKKSKEKKGVKKAEKKRTTEEEDALLKDPDLDLATDVKDIGEYVRDREEMLNQMFHAVKGPSLQRALPDILKRGDRVPKKDKSIDDPLVVIARDTNWRSVADVPVDVLKQKCLEHLEVMSKKRIRGILSGNDPATISSSGTEDETTDEETKESSQQPADSTSQPAEQRENSENVPPEEKQTISNAEEVEMDVEESDDGVWRTPPIDEEEQEEIEEIEVEQKDDDNEEAQAAADDDGDEEEIIEYEYVEVTASEDEEEEEEKGGKEEGNETGNVIRSVEALEDGNDNGEKKTLEEEVAESVQKMETGEVKGSIFPVLTQNQMELLELEMRARAIKAMLKKHQEKSHQ